MLSKADIDQIEAYLCKASLNDLPNVLMKVLPLMFAELRTMQAALDTQAQEFFRVPQSDERRSGNDAGRLGVGGSGLSGNPQADAALQAARNAGPVFPISQGSPQRPVEASAAGLPREEGVGAVAVDPSGVGSQVGGQVRPEAGNESATGSQPVDAGVKKRRGRPPKQQGVLGIEPIMKQGG